MSFKNLTIEWKQYFEKRSNIYIFIISLVALIIILKLFGTFLIYVENRPGIVLHDPLFKLYNAIEFNTPIFILIYGSIITGIILLIPNPKYLTIALQAYFFMVLFRFIAMYFTPLDVPEGCINLKDPLVFTFGAGQLITKDLFFSGHTATFTILILTARNKFLKWMFLIFMILVVSMILLQKAHYTIDIFAAPFFAYGAYRLANNVTSCLQQSGKSSA